MPIIDPKKGASRPVLCFLELGFNYIQDYGHTVLIVVPYDALVGIGCVGHNHPIPLAGKLGRLVVAEDRGGWVEGEVAG